MARYNVTPVKLTHSDVKSKAFSDVKEPSVWSNESISTSMDRPTRNRANCVSSAISNLFNRIQSDDATVTMPINLTQRGPMSYNCHQQGHLSINCSALQRWPRCGTCHWTTYKTEDCLDTTKENNTVYLINAADSLTIMKKEVGSISLINYKLL